jgi:hypothetical protein
MEDKDIRPVLNIKPKVYRASHLYRILTRFMWRADGRVNARPAIGCEPHAVALEAAALFCVAGEPVVVHDRR